MEDLVVTALLDLYQSRRVLVTGDTGFKGSWLSIWLNSLGAQVCGFSLEPRTENDNYVRCGVDNLVDHVQGDVRDLERLLTVFDTHRPQIVFHLAAQPIVLQSYDDPITTFSTNIMGTVNVMEAIRQTSSVRAAVIITSDKCYENTGSGFSFQEEDRLGGSDPYSASKGAAELVIASYVRSYFTQSDSVAVASVRAGNVVGGGDWSPYRLFPDCIRSLKSETPIVVRNPGAIRPWQYVLEPLYGYLLLGALLYSSGKEYSGAWNFGPLSTGCVPVVELVRAIIEAWGGGSYVIDEKRSQNGEAPLLQLDISKALNRLGWRPMLGTKETVQRTVDEYRVEGMAAHKILKQRLLHIENYVGKVQSRG